MENLKLSDWNSEDRPRERLLSCGASSLSTAEIVAILLRTGVPGANAVDTARKLLQSAGNSLTRLSEMSVESLCRIQGIGKGKALIVVAAFELERRLARERHGGRVTIDNPRDAADVLRTLFTDFAREECWCLFLKRSRLLIGSMRVSEGGESMTEINIKKIVRRALDLSAVSVILSHNHPGGNPRPSPADIRLTKQLKQALGMFELALTDHIILSERGCYSFSQETEF